MIVTISQAALGTLLIVQGLFLLFALAFNGSVGETFVNYSFFSSACAILITGGLTIAKVNWRVTMGVGIASITLYLPMIW
jgi:hypothetical protein